MNHKREKSIGALILIIVSLAFILGWTNIFTVKAVTVSGSPNKDVTSQILKIADIQIGEKLARVEPRNISSKLALAGIDWIENVKVNRNWISRKVDINLRAREAIAIAGDKSVGKYVDAGGTIFTSPIQVSKELPSISAIDSGARTAAVNFYLTLPNDFRVLVSKLAATSSDNFQIVLKNKVRIIWGGNRDNALKIKVYKALIALPENEKIVLVDLSDPTKPIVK